MRIAIVGGTGDIGAGLVLRLAVNTNHEVIVGSRSQKNATSAVQEYNTQLKTHDVRADLGGARNSEAVANADLVILAVPSYHVGDTVDAIADRLYDGQALVTPAVGMKGDDDGLHYNPPEAGSVTELVADRAPSSVSVVGAFHNLSANTLTDLTVELNIDTLLVGDDPDAKDIVRAVVDEIDGLRALDAGPLANAGEVETLTPLLINVARYNDGMHDLGVFFR
jgi:NADPH-dependent F420 reductase